MPEHRRPQQEPSEICGLDFPTILQFLALDAVAGPRDGIEASDLDLLTAGDADAVLARLHAIESLVNPSDEVALTDSQLVAQVPDDG